LENRRLRLLQHWFAGRRNGVGFWPLVKMVLGPRCGVKARRYIARIGEDAAYRVVHLRGLERPLYFPKSVDPCILDQLVVELFHPVDWHYYQIEPTRLRADDVVLDCGAAEGLFALQAEAVCRRVYAAEPIPLWLEAMGRTFAGSNRVEILPYALSDANEPLRMQVGVLDSHLAGDDGGITVQARTIDSLFADQGRELTYLKGDIEGAEPAVLRGAERTIRQCRPRIAFTTYHQADHAGWISRYLRGLHPSYRILVKGIEHRAGAPVMLHAWLD
jgi:FkbM family methyltransferase